MTCLSLRTECLSVAACTVSVQSQLRILDLFLVSILHWHFALKHGPRHHDTVVKPDQVNHQCFHRFPVHLAQKAKKAAWTLPEIFDFLAPHLITPQSTPLYCWRYQPSRLDRWQCEISPRPPSVNLRKDGCFLQTTVLPYSRARSLNVTLMFFAARNRTSFSMSCCHMAYQPFCFTTQNSF